jgi:hypothetical protein
MHPQVCGDFSEALSAGGEESAQQAAGLQFLEPGVPGLGAGAEAIEDSSQLDRNRGLNEGLTPMKCGRRRVLR